MSAVCDVRSCERALGGTARALHFRPPKIPVHSSYRRAHTNAPCRANIFTYTRKLRERERERGAEGGRTGACTGGGVSCMHRSRRKGDRWEVGYKRDCATRGEGGRMSREEGRVRGKWVEAVGDKGGKEREGEIGA